ncbi:hypothetical protein CEE37_07205 [candidate division LCP-89 bacterium B3_LCP]|uniref:DUF4861 domain-containing protein n=1 Tax=candidate division LCP-89 bacterium B3_LCP TaxID=2012998 RepID=A0A532V0K2_UNCL8|nr:MAG: hypothetical protein CEE37_07205 [candidate division LCP-89 bacterium B3_LCP]
MKYGIPIFLFGLLWLSGCSANLSPASKSQPENHNNLSMAISFEERIEGNGGIPIDSFQHLAKIASRSELVIMLNQEMIEKIAKHDSEKIDNVQMRMSAKLHKNNHMSIPVNIDNYTDEIERIDSYPRLWLRDLNNIATGRIHLNIESAEQGDELEIVTEIIKTDSNGRELVLQKVTKCFDIERFGYMHRFISHPAIAGLIDEDDGFDNWASALAVSWTVHWKIRTNRNSPWICRAYSFINPGIGLNFIQINDDDWQQSGIGFHLSIFNDGVMGGYGRTEFEDQYYFFGIGFIDFIDKIDDILGLSQ